MLDVFIQLRSQFALPKSIREIQYSSAQRYMVTSRICYTTSNSTEIGANRNNSRERKWIDMHVLIRLARTHTHKYTFHVIISDDFANFPLHSYRADDLAIRIDCCTLQYSVHNHHCRNRQRFVILLRISPLPQPPSPPLTSRVNIIFHRIFCSVSFRFFPAVSTKFIFT